MGSTKLAYPAGESGDGHRKEVGFLPLGEDHGHAGRKLPGGSYHTAVPDRKGKRRKVIDPRRPPRVGFRAGKCQEFPGGGEIQKVFTTQGLTSTLEKAIISCVVCEPLYD